MIKLFYTLFFLVLSSSSVSGVGLARLIQEESFAKDRLFGGLEINLKLSQGVPYKMNFLEKPLSLIIDFNVLSFDGSDLQKLNRSKNIKLILDAYLRGQLLVSLSLCFYYSLFFYFLELNYSLFIGVFAGFFSFIPLIGIIFSFFITSILAYLQFVDPIYIIYVLGGTHQKI